MKSGDEKEAKSEFDPEVDAEIASNQKMLNRSSAALH